MTAESPHLFHAAQPTYTERMSDGSQPDLDSAQPPAAVPKAVITISRDDEADVRQRQIVTRLDDRAAATLIFGDSVTWDVEPGAHRLRSHNTLIRKTVKFDAAPGEHVEFVVVNRSGSMTLGFLALLGAAPLYLTVERRHTQSGIHRAGRSAEPHGNIGYWIVDTVVLGVNGSAGGVAVVLCQTVLP